MDVKETTLAVHACFLIKSMSQRDEHIRDVSVKLLSLLRDRFPQVSFCICPNSILSFDLFSTSSHGCRYCGIHLVWTFSYSLSIMIRLQLLLVILPGQLPFAHCTKKLFANGLSFPYHTLHAQARVFFRRNFVKQTHGKEHSQQQMLFLYCPRYESVQAKAIAGMAQKLQISRQ